MNLEDMKLKKEVESIFVDPTKVQGEMKPNELAAMITAASSMSVLSQGIATPEMTTTELLDLYGKKEDPQVTSLIGMSPTFVNSTIGYSVDFRDMSHAMANYDNAKYDPLYTSISNRHMSHEMESGKHI